MTQILQIHPENPQMRFINDVVDVLKNDGVIIYPTDSAYALGCKIGSKIGMEKIRRIRNLDKNHNFTLVCRDLADISRYALVNNVIFRLLKSCTPGPYTFILEATKDVPKMLQHPKRKTIGIRIPDNVIVQAILKELNEPLVSVTLILSDNELPVSTLDEIYDVIDNKVDIVVDGGSCGTHPTTVVDFTSGVPNVLREGKGKTDIFNL